MDPLLHPEETEWLEDGRGAAVPLPTLLYPTVERWVDTIIDAVQMHLENEDPNHDWCGARENIARCLQAIVDDEINRALSKLERTLIKETR